MQRLPPLSTCSPNSIFSPNSFPFSGGISISFLVSRSNLDRAPFSGFIDAINSERELGLENIYYFSSPYLLPHLFWYSFLKNRKDCRADVVLSNSRRNLIPRSNRRVLRPNFCAKTSQKQRSNVIRIFFRLFLAGMHDKRSRVVI